MDTVDTSLINDTRLQSLFFLFALYLLSELLLVICTISCRHSSHSYLHHDINCHLINCNIMQSNHSSMHNPGTLDQLSEVNGIFGRPLLAVNSLRWIVYQKLQYINVKNGPLRIYIANDDNKKVSWPGSLQYM